MRRSRSGMGMRALSKHAVPLEVQWTSSWRSRPSRPISSSVMPRISLASKVSLPPDDTFFFQGSYAPRAAAPPGERLVDAGELNMTRPVTPATHPSGDPLPEPMRVSAILP